MAGAIKAIIWDTGGVLLQEMDPAPRRELAVEYQLDLGKLNESVFLSESVRLAGLGTITEEELWNYVAQTHGIPPQDLRQFQERFWSGNRIDPMLNAFIGALKQHYQTALLSNAWSNTRRILDEYYDCLGLFNQVIISAEVKMSKPDPAIYQAMIKLLGVRPQQAIFVDDLQENIDAANELGIHGIRFTDTQQAIADVKKLLV